MGATLLQDGKPIEYASRALTSAERNWAQIEETLAVVFGLERFDQYTYGSKVVVENDHKPLASILKKPLSQAPKRLQALILRLHRYDVDFHYIEGSKLFIADTLSRAYLDVPDTHVRVMTVNALKGESYERIKEVKEATTKDESMQTLLGIIKEGWPEHKKGVPSAVRPYFDERDTLSHQDGVILKGERVVILKSLRDITKKRLHSAHLGYDSMMRRYRDTVFWPAMSTEIRQVAENCEACQLHKPRNQKETLKQHEEGETAWSKIGVDLYEIKGGSYLVTVDYYSNFIEVDYLSTTTTRQVITKLKGHFARYGIPVQIVTDSGSQFLSRQFKDFTRNWGIGHATSSPEHHKSNGKAEAAVKIAKMMMRKALLDGTDQYEALLELRNTPRQDTGVSPAEMMFGRNTRSMLPSVGTKRIRSKRQVTLRRLKRRLAIRRTYDKGARDLKRLTPGQPVYYQHTEGKKCDWRRGTVRTEHSDRSYTIHIIDGKEGIYRRNRVHLRPTTLRASPERSPPPADENAHSPPAHTEKRTES